MHVASLAFHPLFSYFMSSPVLIIHAVCFIDILMNTLTSGQVGQKKKISNFTNTGTFTIMLINMHCPL